LIGIYARVSTEEQAKKGFSLQDQIRECRRKAGTMEVMEYTDEGISGEFLDRPALARLRDDVKKGRIQKVICLDPDRLSRKLINQLIVSEEWDGKGVELLFINGEYAKTPEGQLFYAMRGAIAEFDKAKITENMKRGRRSKARAGKVLRDFQIYGYDYDKKTERLVVNEAEAGMVCLIFALFTKPNRTVQGINGIAKYLTDQGIPTKRSANIWHRQVVRQILMNTAYIGEFYQNRWNAEGMLGNKYRDPTDRIPLRARPKEEWIPIPCPPIIDKVTFQYAQKLLHEAKRRWTQTSKHAYLLSGLLRCGDCRNTMTGRKKKNWGRYEFEYTDQKNTAGVKHPGCGRRVKCKEMDSLVWEQISAWLNRPNEITAAAEQVTGIDAANRSFAEAEMAILEKEIALARQGRKNFFKFIAKAADVTDEIMEEIHLLKVREDRLTQQLYELTENLQEQQAVPYTDGLIKEAAQYYLEKGHLAFAEQKELIRQVVREIIVFQDRVEIHTF
jgi:site-specific DNA recombinase